MENFLGLGSLANSPIPISAPYISMDTDKRVATPTLFVYF